MKIASLCLLSFVFASETKFSCIGKEGARIVLTFEQLKKCLPMRDCYETFPLQVAEESVCEVKSFEEYSVDVLNLFFGTATIGLRNQKIETIISLLKLMDYCSNMEEVNLLLKYLRKLCTLANFNNVITLLEGLGKPLLNTFLGGFSWKKLYELEFQRYSTFPMKHSLRIDGDSIPFLLNMLDTEVNFGNLEKLELVKLSRIEMYAISGNQDLRKLVLKFLSSVNNLKELYIHYDSIIPSMSKAVQIISRNKKLEIFSFCPEDIDEMRKYLFVALSCPNLQELIITCRFPTLPSGEFLIEVMGNLKFYSVKRLVLKFISLRDPIDWVGFLAKFPNLKEITIKLNSPKLRLNTLLQGLIANRIKLDKFAFQNVAQVFGRRKILGNSEREIHEDLFHKFLDSCPDLKVLDMTGNCMHADGNLPFGHGRVEHIKELLLGGNKLFVDGLFKTESNYIIYGGEFKRKTLIPRLDLGSFHSLEVLDLEDNELNDLFFKDILGKEQAIKNLKTLKTLCLSKNPLNSSNLEDSQPNLLGFGESLAKFIGHLSNLRELEVLECRLDSRFIKLLVSNEAPKMYSNLEKLNLSHNPIIDSEESFNNLLVLLSRCPNLVSLSLAGIFKSDYFDSPSCTSVMFNGLEISWVFEKLEFIDISGDTWGYILQFWIRNIAKFAPNLKDLTMYNKRIEIDFADLFSKLIREGKFANLTSLTLDGSYLFGTDKDTVVSNLFEGLKYLPRLQNFYFESHKNIPKLVEFTREMPFIE